MFTAQTPTITEQAVMKIVPNQKNLHFLPADWLPQAFATVHKHISIGSSLQGLRILSDKIKIYCSYMFAGIAKESGETQSNLIYR